MQFHHDNTFETRFVLTLGPLSATPDPEPQSEDEDGTSDGPPSEG